MSDSKWSRSVHLTHLVELSNDEISVQSKSVTKCIVCARIADVHQIQLEYQLHESRSSALRTRSSLQSIKSNQQRRLRLNGSQKMLENRMWRENARRKLVLSYSEAMYRMQPIILRLAFFSRAFSRSTAFSLSSVNVKIIASWANYLSLEHSLSSVGST